MIKVLQKIKFAGLLILFQFAIIRSNAITNALKIKLSNISYSDEAVVRFLPVATYGFDSNYDAWKQFGSNSSTPSIYTQLADSSKLSVNALPDYDRFTRIDLFTKISVPGYYTIQAIELGLFSVHSNIKLEDKFTGMIHEFRNGNSINVYLFNSGFSDSSRFVLCFSPPVQYSSTDLTCNGFENGSCFISAPGITDLAISVRNSQNTVVYSANYISDSIGFYGMPSGSYTAYCISNYINPDSFTFTIHQPAAIIADYYYSLLTPTTSDVISFYNESQNAQFYIWDFGDGTSVSSDYSPEHQYLFPGVYIVTLHALEGECEVNYSSQIEVLPTIATTITGTPDVIPLFNCFQNGDGVHVQFKKNNLNGILSIYNVLGAKVSGSELFNSDYSGYFPLSKSGIYFVCVESEALRYSEKLNFIKN